MRLHIDVHLDYALPAPADILLQVEAAMMPDQTVIDDRLTIWSDTPIRSVGGYDRVGRLCWARGVDRLTVHYRATVDVARASVVLGDYPPTSPRMVPGAVTAYLMPSRYCQSDRLEGFVRRRFAGLQGGALAVALVAWITRSIDYRSNSSTGDTTALDTFAARSGVCRDYAHLLVALARAGDIPARCVSAYAPGVDPPDFHAVAELWLDGDWRLVDPTGMANCQDLVRICVGRDATDIAFMTIFGAATLLDQRVAVKSDRNADAPASL
ncbi:transglutaminase family protein [uncultured Sphingomonas sp.]|uniref:transglutaminase-like domain-containing protein n=1 Tax=uncultured Sphingomonas sp. TaxID=158754 RepID=UPI0035CC0BB7